MALEEIVKGMSNAAEVIDANFKKVGPLVEDTGWLVLPLQSNFEAYTSGKVPMYRRIGAVVQIRGAVRNKAILPSGQSESYTIATLPDLIVPTEDSVSVQQGSGMNRFMCTVSSSNKNIQLARFGIVESTQVQVGSWLNLHATYFI